MEYETEVGSSKIKSAAPVKVQRTLDGGKGDVIRPSVRRDWDVGYVRTFVFRRDWHKARELPLWDAAVRWLAENAVEFVADARRLRAEDVDGWMEEYWMGRNAAVVNVMRRWGFDEYAFGVESVQIIYPVLLEEAADV